MKKLIVYALLLLIFAYAKICNSQSETSLKDILGKVSDKVKELEEVKKQEVVNITVDLLVKDAQKSFVRYLDPNFDYTVIAISDAKIDKLTLTIYRQNLADREYLTENTGANSMVHISLLDSEPFEFGVSVNQYSGSNIAGHFAVIIYHKIP